MQREILRGNEVDQSRFEEALGHIAQVGNDLKDTKKRLLAPKGDPFLDALALCLTFIGRTPKPSPADVPGMTIAARLAAYGHSSGFRVRRVTLRGRWWSTADSLMVATTLDTQTPVALIPDKGGFLLRRPGGADHRIDATAAKDLSADAFQIYDTLPEKAGPRGFLQLAARSSGGDLARILWVALGAAVLSLAVPIVFGNAVAVAIPEGRKPLLLELTIVLIAAVFGGSLLQAYKAFAISRLTGRADLRLQAAIWDRVLKLRSVFFRKWTTGDLALRLLGVDSMRRILSNTLLGGILSGVFGIMNIIVMIVVSGSLASWAIVYALFVGLVFAVLTIAQVRLQRISYDLRGRIQSLIVQFLGAIPKLRVAGVERRAFALWAELYSRQRGTDARSAVYRSMSMVLQTVMLPLASFGIFILIGSSQTLSTAAFVTFNTAFGQLLASTIGLFAALTGSLVAVPLWERLQPILDAPIEETAGREDPGEISGGVSGRNLVFRYAPDAPVVLDGLSFDIKPGEFVGLVGHSGCGKSTLIRLLLGLDIAEQGAVFYDGRDLSRLDVRRVRQQIGTVLQETGLIPGSIFENVAGARPFSEEEVMEALRMAGIADDVAQMPMGLQTVVTEGGSTFSGGQRQRVMIARALISRPKLLLFDEATSALDNVTQKIVTDSLRELAATRIVIAHRLSTILDADIIFVIDGGKIVERGTYQELLEQGGVFHQLAARQIV